MFFIFLCEIESKSRNAGRFEVDYTNNRFLLNGNPFRHISGTIHYFGVPEKYWKDRLMKLKAMAANALQTYINWFLHEENEGKYDFHGMCRCITYLCSNFTYFLLAYLNWNWYGLN